MERLITITPSIVAILLLFASQASAQGPDERDLSGTWRVTSFAATWTIELRLADAAQNSDGDLVFCGVGTRDDPDDNGENVFTDMCLWRFIQGNTLRMLASSTIVACEAPFQAAAVMTGTCVFLRARSGIFRAIRATDDTTGPQLTITSHFDNQTVSSSSVTLAGTANDAGRGDSGISSVTVNGVRANNDIAIGSSTASWSQIVTLKLGLNVISVVTKDNSPAQNVSRTTIRLNLGGCSYSLSPSTVVAPVGGTTGSLVVTAGAGCAWTAATDSTWLTISSGTPGTGNGTISYSVATNTGRTGRTGRITVAGQSAIFYQAGPEISSDSPTASSYHVFPAFADGRLSDGTYYRTTLMISNPTTGLSAICELRLRGLTVQGFALTYTIGGGGLAIVSTSGTQNFQSGYATLQCSGTVEAQLLYSFYEPTGAKIAEATVFSSPPASFVKVLADEREGAQVGLAIANDSDTTVTYAIASGGFAGTVTLGPRSSIAKFINEFMPGLPPNNSQQVSVSSTSGTASIIGLRFTGRVFTTLPEVMGSSITPGRSAGTYHVFPQFADGKFENGSSFRATRMYANTSSTVAADCTTQLRGLTSDGSNQFTEHLPAPGSSITVPTRGTQAIQSGYATVECSVKVEAFVLYSYYGATGLKLSEATVFSSPSARRVQILVDNREGARVGLAVANDTDQTNDYTITVRDANGNSVGSKNLTLGPRSSTAAFVDDLVSLPANHYGPVVVSSMTGKASIIGLRFTGAIFTTIPETILSDTN